MQRKIWNVQMKWWNEFGNICIFAKINKSEANEQI